MTAPDMRDETFALRRPTFVSGSCAQIEWAETIRVRVEEEFDRVAAALQSVAIRQDGDALTRTQAMLEILEDARSAVMANDQAGYFIREWQELSDQVRQLMRADPRFVGSQRSVSTAPA